LNFSTALTVGVSAAVAILVVIVRYIYDIRLSARRAQLERVNEQLRFFYGPLYSNLKMEQDLFQTFKNVHSPGEGFWQNLSDSPTPKQAEAWRRWMKDVFAPINESMLRLVTNRADLIEETEIPECFVLLNRHVASYRMLFDQWGSGDYSEHLPRVFFPAEELHGYVDKHFRDLKVKQARLVGTN
jgi:hypothetical protein